jgi:hypothetical protein
MGGLAMFAVVPAVVLSSIIASSVEDVFMASMMAFGCIYLGIIAFFIAMFWNIFAKAGFSGARAFLLFIPIVNIVIILMFAFGEWPMRRELEMLRMQVRMSQMQGPNIQQISLNAGAPQFQMPPQPYQPPTPYPQYQQSQPPYQPPYPRT